MRTLRDWATHGDNERIAIVTHGGFADALLKALLHGAPVSQNGHGPDYFYLHFNTAIDRVDFDPDGHLRIAYLNRVAHLPGEMIS
jgi:broad specificity phosphatase PhoE